MKLTTLASAAAAAALTVALGAPMANAADTRTTGNSTPTFAGDCYRTHFWNGVWHPYSRVFCDYDPGFDRDYYVHHPEFRYHGDRDRDDRSGFRDHDSDRTGTRDTDRAGSRDTDRASDRGTAGAERGGESGTTTGGGTTGGGTTGGGTMPGGR